MGEQRQLFRFRLPWLSAAPTPRPAPAPPRPAAEPQPRPAPRPQAASQPTTTMPIQRPPFRPAGIAPVQTTPTQSQQQKAEPQPATTSRAGATSEVKSTSRPASPPRLMDQSRAASVPPSPSRRATETQVSSRPISPSRGTIQTQATSQPRSPSRAPTQARAASVPPSPSRIASQPQSTAQTVSKQSPPRLAAQPGQTSSQPSSPTHRATQVQTLSPPKKLPTATSTQPPLQTTFRPFVEAVKPSEAPAQVKEVATVTVAAIEAPSAPAKPKGREERKKAAEEHRKAAAKASAHEQTEAGTKTRELMGAALETGKKQQEKQEDIERKKAWTISSTDEKQIKTVSSTYPKDESTGHPKEITSNLEKVPLHKEIREDISKFVHKLATGQPKLPTDEKSISVLTLAGENRGASFSLGSESTKKDGSVHIHRGYKLNPDDSPDATTDGEGSSRARKPKDSITKENPAPTAYVNSNTQGINNSIVFESSVNERNPGVHLEFLQDFGESTKSSTKAEPIVTHKAEVNITPAEKLTYEPTVRRRCLRGLFAEPSDSDPDNPEKPQRHGCRYSCGQKNKEKEIEVL